jgi:hypothetical protein
MPSAVEKAPLSALSESLTTAPNPMQRRCWSTEASQFTLSLPDGGSSHLAGLGIAASTEFDNTVPQWLH